jgi:hypothetical protein
MPGELRAFAIVDESGCDFDGRPRRSRLVLSEHGGAAGEKRRIHARLSRKSVLSGRVKSMLAWACALSAVIASSRF